MHFAIKNLSRLRRGDFRYTKIFYNSILLLKIFRASGEAILGTQRYFSKDALIPTSLLCGFSNSPLRTQGGLQVTKSKIRRPVARLVARLVARQFCVAHRSKKKSPFSGEAILGTQRYLEARFSTIAVYQASVLFGGGG